MQSDFDRADDDDDDEESAWFTFTQFNSSPVNGNGKSPVNGKRASANDRPNESERDNLKKNQSHGEMYAKDTRKRQEKSDGASSPEWTSLKRDELFFLFGAPLANWFVPLEYSPSHASVPFFSSFPLVPSNHTIAADAADDTLDDEKSDDAIIATLVMDQWANFAKFG